MNMMHRNATIVPITEAKDWSEQYEIGKYEAAAIERGIAREVEFCEELCRFLKLTVPEDNSAYVTARRDLRAAKSARDAIVKCHSIRVIPDEDQ